MKKIDPVKKNILCKWASGLAIAFVISMALSLILAVVVKGNSAALADNPLLLVLTAVLGIIFTIAGPASLVIGIYAIVKFKEWSICMCLAVSYILAILIFVLGDILCPH